MTPSLDADHSDATADDDVADTLVVQAPAKLNLSLSVLGKRDDGFHELESHFAAVSLYDTLEMQPRDDGDIRLELLGASRDVRADESNLVVCAARSLQKSSNSSLGASLRLTKRIPSQAGLGGGSSDAAAALIGLNALWRTGRTEAELHEIAAGLGSDLNFFIARTPVGLASGRGENITALPLRQAFSVVIAKPPFGASTGRVFEQLRITGSNVGERRQQSKYVQNVLLGRVAPHNDLQDALEEVEPQFEHWLAELNRLTRFIGTEEVGQQTDACVNQPTDDEYASPEVDRGDTRSLWTLTGSGTAVYRFVATPQAAASLAARVRAALHATEVFTAGPGRLSIQRCQAKCF